MHKSRDIIKEKCRENLARGVRLLYDHAPVHTIVTMKAAIQQSDFWEINHLPYSFDLTISSSTSSIEVGPVCKKLYDFGNHFTEKNSDYVLNGTEKLIRRSEKIIPVILLLPT